jgi:hypothetical protein
MDKLYLSAQEIIELTGYTVTSYQMKTFQQLGIPAVRRTDGSLLVMRMHCHYPVPWIYSPLTEGLKQPAPQRKSLRTREESKALAAEADAAAARGRRTKG